MKKLLLLIPFLFLPHLVFGAVAYDNATNSGDISGVTSASWTHNNIAGNYLIVSLSGWDDVDGLTGITVKYNGVTMTYLGGQSAGGDDQADLWGLVAPSTGSNTVAITNIPASFAELGGGSISFTGVDQTVPTGTIATGLVSTLNITLSAGDMGVDGLYNGVTGSTAAEPLPGTSETMRVNTGFLKDAGANRDYMMSGTEGGSGTVTMNWTNVSGDNAMVAIPLKAAAAATTPTPAYISFLGRFFFIGQMFFR